MGFTNQMSITAATGVGSTTVVARLREHFANLPYRFVSGGVIMRAKATSLNMSIERFVVYNREHPEEGHDRDCDTMIAHFAEHDYVICEGRLPHLFMPEAYHVFLTCNERVRTWRRSLQEGHEDLSEKEIFERIADRDLHDRARYAKLYGKECLWTPDRYDIVIDNTVLSIEETVARVLSGYAEWQPRTVSV